MDKNWIWESDWTLGSKMLDQNGYLTPDAILISIFASKVNQLSNIKLDQKSW